MATTMTRSDLAMRAIRQAVENADLSDGECRAAVGSVLKALDPLTDDDYEKTRWLAKRLGLDEAPPFPGAVKMQSPAVVNADGSRPWFWVRPEALKPPNTKTQEPETNS